MARAVSRRQSAVCCGFRRCGSGAAFRAGQHGRQRGAAHDLRIAGDHGDRDCHTPRIRIDLTADVTPREKTVLDFALQVDCGLTRGICSGSSRRSRRTWASAQRSMRRSSAACGRASICDSMANTRRCLPTSVTWTRRWAPYRCTACSRARGNPGKHVRIARPSLFPDACRSEVTTRAVGASARSARSSRPVSSGDSSSADYRRLCSDESLRQYCRDNAITRRLDDKLPTALRSSFRQAVLVKYIGTAREQIEALDQLPVPTLIHITEYLKAGSTKNTRITYRPRRAMAHRPSCAPCLTVRMSWATS